jgi:hypothetical protein
MSKLFSGVYPCGIVYADRHWEKHGDYVRLAFLQFSTLQLDIEKDCPKELAAQIRRDAATIQARKGEFFPVSTCGQTVLLGSALVQS